MNHLLHLQTQKHESHNLLGVGYDDEFLECILGKKFTPGNARSIRAKIISCVLRCRRNPDELKDALQHNARPLLYNFDTTYEVASYKRSSILSDGRKGNRKSLPGAWRGETPLAGRQS